MYTKVETRRRKRKKKNNNMKMNVTEDIVIVTQAFKPVASLMKILRII